MMKHIHFFTPWSYFLVVLSCTSGTTNSNDVQFTNDELSYLDMYQQGDTVVFSNNNKISDTIVIVKVVSQLSDGTTGLMSTSSSNIAYVEIRHIPNDPWGGYVLSQDGKKKKTNQSLIIMSKTGDDIKTSFSTSYRNFTSGTDTLLGEFIGEVELGGAMFRDCYKIAHGYPERVKDSSDVVELYWAKNVGLAGYINSAGETWVLQP